MCPSAPVSLSPPPEDIGFNWTDEELVTCLERIICGAPLPANVITEVNPYNMLPWLLLDDVFYFNSYDLKATETGYWKATEEDHKIFSNCSTIGSRTTLQFYSSQAPNGKKTNWMMHAYRINQERLLELNKGQDSISLCRVFLNHGQSPNHEEQQRGAGGHDVNDKSASLNSEENNQQRGAGGYDVNDKSVSLNSEENNQQRGAGGHDVNDKPVSLNSEENNQNLMHPTSRSQVISRDNERGPLAVFGRDLREPNPDYSTEDLDEIYDFSEGDFLELQDLADPESPSSSSESSSCLTMSPDEYFDPSALLRDLEADQEMQRKNTDNNLSVPGALRPTPVAIRVEPSGAERQLCDTLASNDVLNMNNAGDVNEGSPECLGAERRLLETLASNDVLNRNNAGDVNDGSPKSSENEAGSSSSPESVNQAAPAAAESEDTVGRSRSSSSRMSKLKKKYLCFIAFFPPILI